MLNNHFHIFHVILGLNYVYIDRSRYSQMTKSIGASPHGDTLGGSFVLKMMAFLESFVLKMMAFVQKMMDCVLKMVDLVLQ